MDNYQVNFPVMLGVIVDAAKNNLSSIAIDTTLELPAGFVATGVVFEEMVKAGSSVNITLKAKTADATLAGGTIAVGGDTLKKDYFPAKTAACIATVTQDAETKAVTTTNGTVPASLFTAAGDIVTIASSANLTSGKFRIGIVGFLAGMTSNVYPVPGSDAAKDWNKAPVDPYTPPEKQ